MRARRLPTGGLASLAVVLTALAVVVVAGAPPPGTRVVIERTTRIEHVPTGSDPPGHRSTHPGSRRGSRGVHERAPSARLDARDTKTSAPGPTATTTSTTPTSTTTTTTTPPTTTTTAPPPPPAPTSRRGVFEGGTTSASTRVGAVQAVTVSVPAGIKVSLTVVCGLSSWWDTAMTSATVRVQSGGVSCTATFSIPSSSPQPARWLLTTS